MALKTNYIDSVFTQKKYEKSVGSDGYYRFRDITEYDVIGDYYGANDINAQNSEYNRIATNFEVIQTLIDKIVEKGVTVNDNDIDTILTAIANCASTVYYQAYDFGMQNTILQVKANPGTYGLIDKELVTEISDTISWNEEHIDSVIERLNVTIELHDKPNEPTINFSTDPINSSEAISAKNALYGYAGQTFGYCSSYNSAALDIMDYALTQLAFVR